MLIEVLQKIAFLKEKYTFAPFTPQGLRCAAQLKPHCTSSTRHKAFKQRVDVRVDADQHPPTQPHKPGTRHKPPPWGSTSGLMRISTRARLPTAFAAACSRTRGRQGEGCEALEALGWVPCHDLYLKIYVAGHADVPLSGAVRCRAASPPAAPLLSTCRATWHAHAHLQCQLSAPVQHPPGCWPGQTRSQR